MRRLAIFAGLLALIMAGEYLRPGRPAASVPAAAPCGSMPADQHARELVQLHARGLGRID